MKQNKEYLQKVNAANNEILYIIRPLIVDKKIPEYDLLSSLINSTAKKYLVNRKDLYTKECLVDDIIKEILGNPFLSTTAKTEYCSTVKQFLYAKFDKNVEIAGDLKGETYSKKSISDRASSRIMSIFMAIMSPILITIPLLNLFFSHEETSSDVFPDYSYIIAIIASFITIIIPVILMSHDGFIKFLRTIFNLDESKKKNKKDNKAAS